MNLKKILKAFSLPKDDSARPDSEAAAKNRTDNPHKWIAVDLDGTLAQYSEWKGIRHIGAPVPLMLERVKLWVESGHNVKILTARASVPEGVAPVKKWLQKHGLPDLEVTNAKDFNMLEVWDDRAVQVIRNTGKPIIRHRANSIPKAPLLKNEQSPGTCEIVSNITTPPET